MGMHPLRKYREREGLSKAELAGRLGVSRATITRYENGERQVDRDLWPKFSKITGIPEAALAGIVDWEPEPGAEVPQCA